MTHEIRKATLMDAEGLKVSIFLNVYILYIEEYLK